MLLGCCSCLEVKMIGVFVGSVWRQLARALEVISQADAHVKMMHKAVPFALFQVPLIGWCLCRLKTPPAVGAVDTVSAPGSFMHDSAAGSYLHRVCIHFFCLFDVVPQRPTLLLCHCCVCYGACCQDSTRLCKPQKRLQTSQELRVMRPCRLSTVISRN